MTCRMIFILPPLRIYGESNHRHDTGTFRSSVTYISQGYLHCPLLVEVKKSGYKKKMFLNN